jgi:hypothetical protein
MLSFLGSNIAIILPVLALLGAGAYIVKLKTNGADPAADAKAKLADVGELVKGKVNAVLGDVSGAVDDVDATALDFSTRALWRHYLKHVDSASAVEVTTAFQTLLNLNAKLPTPAAKS